MTFAATGTDAWSVEWSLAADDRAIAALNLRLRTDA